MDSTQATSEKLQGRVVIALGGEQVDLTDLKPMKQRDKRRLLTDPYRLDVNRIGMNMDADQETRFALFIVHQVRPQTTEAELDDLDPNDVQKIIGHWVKTQQRVDRPFSKPSTSSPASTDGTSETSRGEVPPSSTS